MARRQRIFLSVSRVAVGDIDGSDGADLVVVSDAGKLRVYLAELPR